MRVFAHVFTWLLCSALVACQQKETATNRCAGCCEAASASGGSLPQGEGAACAPVTTSIASSGSAPSAATPTSPARAASPPATPQPQEAQLVIGILGFDSVLASDVTAPLEVFGAARTKSWFKNYSVQLIAGGSSEFITTAEGFRLGVDTHISEVKKLEVLLVPGSYEMDTVIKQAELLEFVTRQKSETPWLASNCAGAFLLGAGGALDGKRATTYHGGAEALSTQVPGVVSIADQPVVVDGHLVTSNGSAVSYVSALVLLGLLTEPAHAHEIFDYLQLSRLISWEVVNRHFGAKSESRK